MELPKRLALALVENYAEDAASVLEAQSLADATSLLTESGPAAAARVLRCAAPNFAAKLFAGLPSELARETVSALGLDTAALLLRRLDKAKRDAILGQLDERVAGPLRTLLSFPAGTAGALMDPLVLALPDDLSVQEAMARVRRSPEHARYNLYITDRAQKLVGVLNLRELLIARPRAAVAEVMQRNAQRLRASADRHEIIAHPGWKRVHALPVVDRDARYIGALRYKTLRRIEEEIRGAPVDSAGPTTAALGEIFSAGLGGVVESLVGASRSKER